MKKIKYFLSAISIVLIINKTNAQVPDTAQYLIDSIMPKANYYSGKPLKILLNDLKIKPSIFQGILPTLEKPDTILFKFTNLDFYTMAECDRRQSISLYCANLHIEFAQPITIPKSWFMHGGKFEKRNWDRIKRRFFENCIIGSLSIRGI